MMKKIVMPLAAGVLLTAGAQAQELRFGREGQAYTIGSADDGGAGAAFRYEWYRNGALIQCTNPGQATCTVPAELCNGNNVEFTRKVVADESCMGPTEGAATILVSFKCGNGWGTRIANLCWADRNVGAAGAFTATAHEYSPFYQWNKNRAWSAEGSVTGWNSIPNQAATWTVDPHPCPNGWRLPDWNEFQALHNTGYTWATAGARGNTVAGMFYGPNHNNAASCSFSNNTMSDCIFLPASGFRDISNGTRYSQTTNGYYWAHGQYYTDRGFVLNIASSSSSVGPNDKAYGFSVRCVQDQ